jgi:hypothetical protein
MYNAFISFLQQSLQFDLLSILFDSVIRVFRFATTLAASSAINIVIEQVNFSKFGIYFNTQTNLALNYSLSPTMTLCKSEIFLGLMNRMW